MTSNIRFSLKTRGKKPSTETKRKFCDYKCEYAKPSEDVPSCHTYNPIYCKKYRVQKSKMEVCLDDMDRKTSPEKI